MAIALATPCEKIFSKKLIEVDSLRVCFLGISRQGLSFTYATVVVISVVERVLVRQDGEIPGVTIGIVQISGGERCNTRKSGVEGHLYNLAHYTFLSY